MPRIKYEELRPHELEAVIREAPLVYFPVGSMEYHGLHLPFGFDTMHAYELCLHAAQQTGGVVLPPTYWGTEGHVDWPGSVLVSNGTFAGIVSDVLARLDRLGFRLIVICTGHYPDVQGALIAAVINAYTATHREPTIILLDPFNTHPTDPRGEHAGIVETSAMLHLRPDLVDMDKLEQPGALDGISKDCVDATVEYGQRRFSEVLNEIVKTVNGHMQAITTFTPSIHGGVTDAETQ